MDKLLPCPFCGGDRLKHFGKEIQCQQCQALGPIPADGEVTRQIATDWWNRRTPSPQTNVALPQDVIDLVVAAREALEYLCGLDGCELRSVDKAVEAFDDRVPYENKPEGTEDSEG